MTTKVMQITFSGMMRDIFYSIIASFFIAFFLKMIGVVVSLGGAIIVSLCIGVSICVIIELMLWIFKPEKNFLLHVIIFTGVTAGTLIGWGTSSLILLKTYGVNFIAPWDDFWRVMLKGLTFGAVVSYFFMAKAQLKAGRDMIQEEKIKRLSSEKETLEANLKMLQAQIEPHFLFNTLSHILSLIDTDPVKGKSMLTDLIHYLRTALSRTRNDLITIDQEMEIIKAYLNIIKIRMGDRLQYEIMVPESLRTHPFPPMLLQPLVENAIKHGLEPKIEGGELLIKVTVLEKMLKLEVIDTGLGLTVHHESGVGIANVRERLHLLYGEKGRLRLEENKPNGLRVIIEVPA